MCHLGDFRHRIDRTQGVGGIPDGHQAWMTIDSSLHLIHIEGAILRVKIHPAHLATTVFGCHDPGSDVGVMVQSGDDYLITRVESAHQ